jgi:TonB family protein
LLGLAGTIAAAPLPITNTVYDVFGELRVITEGAAIRIAKSEMPPELAGAASRDFAADVRTVLAKRGFTPGPEAANLFLEAFANKGLIAPAAAGQPGYQFYLAVHDFGFAPRAGVKEARSGEELVPLVSNTGQPMPLVGGRDALKAKRSPLFRPAVRVSVDLVNGRNQLVWTRTAVVPPGHPALAGLTAAQLLGDDQQVRAPLKVAFGLAAEDLTNALAAQLAMTPELSPLTPVLELTPEKRGADGFKVKDPVAARAVSPHYAPALREAGITGLAFVEFEVGEDGRVAKIIGAGGVPENLFNEAALLAVRMWRFQPAVFEGQPVRYRATQMVTFKPAPRE